MSSAPKCKPSKIKECVKDDKFCNLETGRCISIENALVKKENNDSIQLNTSVGIVGKKDAIALIKDVLDKLPKPTREKLKASVKQTETKRAEKKEKKEKRKGIQIKEVETVVVAPETSPDDFGEGPVRPIKVVDIDYDKYTIAQLKKMYEPLVPKESRPVGYYKIRKADLIKELQKAKGEIPAPVKTVQKTVTITEVKPSDIVYGVTRKQLEARTAKDLKKEATKLGISKHSALKKDIVIDKILKKLEEDHTKSTKTISPLPVSVPVPITVEKETETVKEFLQNCELCDEDESCNVATGECEKEEDQLWVLIHNNNRYHGSKSALRELIKDAGFEDYEFKSFVDTGDDEDEDEISETEIELAVSETETEPEISDDILEELRKIRETETDEEELVSTVSDLSELQEEISELEEALETKELEKEETLEEIEELLSEIESEISEPETEETTIVPVPVLVPTPSEDLPVLEPSLEEIIEEEASEISEISEEQKGISLEEAEKLVGLSEAVSGRRPLSRDEAELMQKIVECVGM